MHSITTRLWDDWHCHFRLNPMLHFVLYYTATYCGRAIAMPNTRPRPILTAEDIVWYRGEIQDAIASYFLSHSFEPLMTIEIRDTTTPEIIIATKEAGAFAGKVYPRGVTTNAEDGLTDF